MPRYSVLQPIEKDGKLYVPKTENAPTQALTSGGNRGSMTIDVDSTGEIELAVLQAAPMVYGQLPLYQGVPDPIGAAQEREERAVFEAAQARKRDADKAKEMEEFRLFQAARAAEAAAVAAKTAAEARAAEIQASGKKSPESTIETGGTATGNPAMPPVEETKPTFRFEAAKDFQFKGEKHKKGDPLELEMDVAQDIGSDRITLLDTEKYAAYQEELKAKATS